MNKQTLKERTVVSSVTLIASLSAYFYAKSQQKDVMPYIMIAGFAGALIGELVAQQISKKSEK